LVVATIHGETITRSVAGPANATAVNVVADGSGGLVIIYRVETQCEGPGGYMYTCVETVVLNWKAGAATVLARFGGTYEYSVYETMPPKLIDGQILLAASVGSPYEQQERIYVIDAPVKRQAWHDPAG
jgi:hypothetical protein